MRCVFPLFQNQMLILSSKLAFPIKQYDLGLILNDHYLLSG